jgi:alkaline phosphatase D
MLWTRVEAKSGAPDPIELMLEVASDPDFEKRVVAMSLTATEDSDHTVRVLVEDLEPDTVYFYRFVAAGDRSRTGRTWTAPAPDTDVPIRFAWASCQDYCAGFYGAYRRMLVDDRDAPAGEKLRFVLHVGDFMYETRAEGFQMALDADLEPVMLVDRDGKPRMMPPFPSGGGTGTTGGQFTQTLEDYRHVYKTVLRDPDLQEARAQWPFVCVWDDHEFSDDCWQTQANYTSEHSTDEPSQRRRMAGNQAWFEFVPAILSESEAQDGVASAARDFEPVEVDDAPYDDVIDVAESNNEEALASIVIYRRLRFGKHVDLVLTDNRLYRSDHALPEEASVGNPLVFHPRGGLPLEVVNTFDAGRTANGGNPPDAIGGYANTRKASPPGTILGAAQKQWWKDAMAASTATFRVWGNSLPVVRIRLDATGVALFSGDLILSADAWDGFPTERRELMQFLRDEAIGNVISLSGDHHAHLAGLVQVDPDMPDSPPVMVDFAVAGISSTSQFASVAGAIEGAVPAGLEDVVAPVLKLILYDATALGGREKAVVNLNTLIRYGAAAANAAAMTHDLDLVEGARVPEINAHLRYVDTAANGYGVATIDGAGARVTLVTIEQPLEDRGDEGASIRGTAEFMVAAWDDAGPVLDEPVLEGAKPFPLR